MEDNIINIRGIILEHNYDIKAWGTSNHVIGENAYDLPTNLKDKIVVDVGANIGAFSVMAAKRGAVVYAFEPYPKNYEMLLKNIKHNDVEKLVHPLPFAIGKAGKAKLFLHPTRSDWASLDSSLNELNKDDYINVSVVTLKSVFESEKIDNCFFLKLDCEGAEKEIIEEIIAGLYKKIQFISGEFHYSQSETKKELRDLEPYYVVRKKIQEWEYKLERK
jgi:FkbM family methyltransferase